MQCFSKQFENAENRPRYNLLQLVNFPAVKRHDDCLSLTLGRYAWLRGIISVVLKQSFDILVNVNKSDKRTKIVKKGLTASLGYV